MTVKVKVYKPCEAHKALYRNVVTVTGYKKHCLSKQELIDFAIRMTGKVVKCSPITFEFYCERGGWGCSALMVFYDGLRTQDEYLKIKQIEVD